MTYRDDRDALVERKQALEAQLNELRAKLQANASLEAEKLETVRALEETYARLNATKAEATPRRALPLLGRVHVASPCSVSWDSMQGDGQVRHCALCDKDVYNLSAMTRDEAESLLRSRANGELCATFYRRTDGTILTADCEVGVEKKRRARKKAAVAATIFAASAAAGFGAWAVTREHRVAGGITAPPIAPRTETLPTTVTPPVEPGVSTPEPQEMLGGAVAYHPEPPTPPSQPRPRRTRAPR
jgi:hypothetical protein